MQGFLLVRSSRSRVRSGRSSNRQAHDPCGVELDPFPWTVSRLSVDRLESIQNASPSDVSGDGEAQFRQASSVDPSLLRFAWRSLICLLFRLLALEVDRRLLIQTATASARVATERNCLTTSFRLFQPRTSHEPLRLRQRVQRPVPISPRPQASERQLQAGPIVQ